MTNDSEMGGMDIGLDRMSFNNPFTGKHLFTTPEMSVFQDKVTFGTEPWTWMQTAANRDIYRWNEYVERYKTLLKTDINVLLGEYRRGEGIFSDDDKIKEKGGKEKLLESELYELLRGGEPGTSFVREMKTLVDVILQEVQK